MTNFKVVYTVNDPTEIKPKYTCIDNKIHVRLRQYKESEKISGFVNKLTFLLTFLIDRQVAGYSPDYIKDIWKSIESQGKEKAKQFFNDTIIRLQNTPEYHLIENTVSLNIIDCIGIEITPVYAKKVLVTLMAEQFGFIPEIRHLTNMPYTNWLVGFLESIHLNLEEYLFNDNFEIWLTDKSSNVAKATKKYRTKVARKTSSLSDKNSFTLWE